MAAPASQVSTSSAVLRPAQPADAPHIHALIDGVYREYDCKLYLNEETHLVDPVGYFHSHGGEFWVVLVDNVIRASGAVLIRPEYGELKSIYVHPMLRRQGWARRLTQMAIDWTRQAGKPRMILWSDTRFTKAHRLYESMGFVRTGIQDLKDSNKSIEYGYEMALSGRVATAGSKNYPTNPVT